MKPTLKSLNKFNNPIESLPFKSNPTIHYPYPKFSQGIAAHFSSVDDFLTPQWVLVTSVLVLPRYLREYHPSVYLPTSKEPSPCGSLCHQPQPWVRSVLITLVLLSPQWIIPKHSLTNQQWSSSLWVSLSSAQPWGRAFLVTSVLSLPRYLSNNQPVLGKNSLKQDYKSSNPKCVY